MPGSLVGPSTSPRGGWKASTHRHTQTASHSAIREAVCVQRGEPQCCEECIPASRVPFTYGIGIGHYPRWKVLFVWRCWDGWSHGKAVEKSVTSERRRPLLCLPTWHTINGVNT